MSPLRASVPRWFNLLRLLRSFAAPSSRIPRLNFINTPLQRGVANGQGIKNRFNGFTRISRISTNLQKQTKETKSGFCPSLTLLTSVQFSCPPFSCQNFVSFALFRGQQSLYWNLNLEN